jgi:hypothetical protein
MSRMNTLLFGVPAVVLLLLPLLCFALGYYLRDRFDFTSLSEIKVLDP